MGRRSGFPSNGASLGIDGSVRSKRTSVIAPILQYSVGVSFVRPSCIYAELETRETYGRLM
jgi:hypothetical protein